MKVPLVWIKNLAKNPDTDEEINPKEIVSIARIKLTREEEIVNAYKIGLSNGYCIIVTEQDKKKLVS